MQISKSLQEGIMSLETNIRIIKGLGDNKITCRRIAYESGTPTVELAQKVCSKLRNKYKIPAVPTPCVENEILVPDCFSFDLTEIKGDCWIVNITDKEKCLQLSLDDEDDLNTIASIIEKAVSLGFETSRNFWRISNSIRKWYGFKAIHKFNGIEKMPEITFSAIPIPGVGVGISMDCHSLLRSEMFVSDFFDQSISDSELKKRKSQFDRLSMRQEGCKGTLLYSLRNRYQNICWFDRFEEKKDCSTVRPIIIGGDRYESLYDYYRSFHPTIEIEKTDSVAYVSFPNLSEPKAVLAKLLRLRISNEQFKKQFTIPPDRRKQIITTAWKKINLEFLNKMNVEIGDGFWSPTESEHEQLSCPTLLFGNDRVINPPSNQRRRAYQDYYYERINELMNGNIYYMDDVLPNEIYVVTPKSKDWPDELQKKFIESISRNLKKITSKDFLVYQIRANTHQEIIDSLSSNDPSSAIIVFDEFNDDKSTYYLLSNSLSNWKIKRIRKGTVLNKCSGLLSRNDEKSENQWQSMIFLTLMKALDRMGAIPWRVDSAGYDCTLVIDVGRSRRYFALSLMVSRNNEMMPDFLRIPRSFHKTDHNKEEINKEILRDKILEVFKETKMKKFDPFSSVLVMRDGVFIGEELSAIDEAFSMLREQGFFVDHPIIDKVECHKTNRSNVRFWNTHNSKIENVLEGHALYLNESTSIVSCTGAASIPKNSTADPIMLKALDGADIRRINHCFFALSQLNYLSPSKAYKFPQPLKEVDDILKYRQSIDMRNLR